MSYWFFSSWQSLLAGLLLIVAGLIVLFFRHRREQSEERNSSKILYFLDLLILLVLGTAVAQPMRSSLFQKIHYLICWEDGADSEELKSSVKKKVPESLNEAWMRQKIFSTQGKGNSFKLNLEKELTQALEKIEGVEADGRKIILFSSGRQSEGDALQSAERARRAGIPIDVFFLPWKEFPEISVVGFEWLNPPRWRKESRGEIIVQATLPIKVEWQMLIDGERVSEGKAELVQGENRIAALLTAPFEGEKEIEIRLLSTEEEDTTNNSLTFRESFPEQPRVAVVSDHKEGFRELHELFKAEKWKYTFYSPEEFKPEILEEVSLVFLLDCPKSSLPEGVPAKLQEWVNKGGRLVVLGGSQSLTAGEYQNSPLEEILPVFCRANSKRYRPSLALIILLDRSGSMRGENFETALEAAGDVIDLLDKEDEFGVLAYEDRTQWLVPLQPCKEKEDIKKKLDGLEAGGGTNLAEALEKSSRAIDESPADYRHLLILSDGLPYPADYERLTKSIASADITISTVGIGSEAAEKLLQDIANNGKGKYYHSTDSRDLGKIFLKETARVAKTGICEGPFFASEKKGIELGVLAQRPLFGFVETEAKNQEEVLLETADSLPLLVRGEYGSGRTLVFTSEWGGIWGREWSAEESALRRFIKALIDPLFELPASESPKKRVTGHPLPNFVQPTPLLLEKIAGISGGQLNSSWSEVVNPGDRGQWKSEPLFWWFLLTGFGLFLIERLLARSMD